MSRGTPSARRANSSSGRSASRAWRGAVAGERLGVPEVGPGGRFLPSEGVRAVRHHAGPVVLADRVGGDEVLRDAGLLEVLQPVVVQGLGAALLLEEHEVGHRVVDDVELGAALLDLGEHLGVLDVHHLDLDAGLLGERLVDRLLVGVAVGTAAVADDERLGALAAAADGTAGAGAAGAEGAGGRDACGGSADAAQERSAVDPGATRLSRKSIRHGGLLGVLFGMGSVGVRRALGSRSVGCGRTSGGWDQGAGSRGAGAAMAASSAPGATVSPCIA
ncbi:hypothetical protein SPURM210S_07628 [Streptomyces purpurascens]